MGMIYKLEPLETWPLRKSARTSANFKNAKGRISLSQTLADLDREMNQLGARGIVIQTGHGSWAIRQDGQLRADARLPAHPGVILRWKTGWAAKEQAFALESDQYDHWLDNLRAIAKSIEALRGIDRWGTSAGRQWRGYLATELDERIAEHLRIEGSPQPAALASAPDPKLLAACRLVKLADAQGAVDARELLTDGETARNLVARALKRCHPDVPGTGSRASFEELQSIRETLGV